MIDLGFAALLALIAVGFGKRILDWLGQSPEHPLDAIAMAMPLGLGLTALATLALGELGWLDSVGLSVLLAVLVELGIVAWFNLFREVRAWFKTRVRTRSRTSLSLYFAFCLGLVIVGTALTAMTPVTDGDALCYHLQVPKVFLMRGSVGFLPDLHETVYPLVTEMLYAVALEFRGPVACRGIQWVLGLVFAINVTALARPVSAAAPGGPARSRSRFRGSVTACRPRLTTSRSPPLAWPLCSRGFGFRNGQQSRPRSRPAYSWVWRWASNTRRSSYVASLPPQSHFERSTGERQTLAASRRALAYTGGDLSRDVRRSRWMLVFASLCPHRQSGLSLFPPRVRRRRIGRST